MPMTELGLEVSHRCSLECIFCSSSAGDNSQLGELAVPEIRRLLRDAKDLGASTLSISGGEPLIYPRVIEVLSLANQMGFQILLYTCGVIFDECGHRTSISPITWERLREASGDHNLTVIFSLQGPVPRLVDRLMGCESAFSLLTESISNAVTVGLPCECHTVPMKPNYKLIPETAGLAEALGLRKMSFLRFVPQGRGRENLDKLALSPAEFLEVQYILLQLRKEVASRSRAIDVRLGCPIDFQFLIDPTSKKRPCRGGTDAPLVLPDGSVQMCPAWKDLTHLSAGSVRTDSLRHVWCDSPFYVLFRGLIQNPSSLKGPCAECTHVDECKGGCTAQRILAHSKGNRLQDCLYESPDPLCPLACGLLQ